VKGALEEGALVGDAVGVRGLHVRVAADAELVVAQIIDQDHEEVGLLHGASGVLAGSVDCQD
jgi:hypothetical protein